MISEYGTAYSEKSADQGENKIMIKVLFICHGRRCTFVRNALKSGLLGHRYDSQIFPLRLLCYVMLY